MTSEQFEEPLFGQFRINVKKRELWKANKIIPLAPQAFSLLQVLYEHKGEIVSLGDLKRLVWKTDHVENHNVRVHVQAVRKVLDDLEGKYVQTVGSLGYILICDGTDFYSPGRSNENSFKLIVDGMIINSVAELLHDDNETRTIRPLCHAS
jgi:DNA-binding winged helix-turn-helix (wHTH) protein